jgi:glucose/mannose transport system substrate-binding protein
MLSKKLSVTVFSLMLAVMLVLSACGPTPTTAVTAKPKSTEVEIFSWWVGPGEADGLAAMVKVFNQQYPDIKFVNAAVAGGAGTNAKAVLATRLAANDAPDSWQAHAGQETIANYVAAKQVSGLNFLFDQTGFTKVLPPTLLPLISVGTVPYSVPVNIHRSNVLWYNPKVLAAAGVTANPKTDFKTLDDFFAACEKIKAADKLCLSLGAPWTGVHLFENIMIGTIGADKWNGLWTNPPTTDWAGADVTKGIANFAKTLSYTNPDASTLSDWQTPSKMMTDGDAAFNIMGDWAYGYFANAAPNGLALKPHTDFDWAVSPGTYGIFNFLSDSFVLPVNAKHPDAALAWLTVAASKAGQEAFNPLKGSICARTDCDQSLFSEYSQDAAKDWTSNVVVGSLMHGVVAAPAWATSIGTAIGLFQTDTSKTADFQAALVAACKADGTCPK